MHCVDQALETIGQSILPNLSRLLDSVIDSATLARPGHDAAEHADGLRNTAWDVTALTELVAAVAPLAQDSAEPLRISA